MASILGSLLSGAGKAAMPMLGEAENFMTAEQANAIMANETPEMKKLIADMQADPTLAPGLAAQATNPEDRKKIMGASALADATSGKATPKGSNALGQVTAPAKTEPVSATTSAASPSAPSSLVASVPNAMPNGAPLYDDAGMPIVPTTLGAAVEQAPKILAKDLPATSGTSGASGAGSVSSNALREGASERRISPNKFMVDNYYSKANELLSSKQPDLTPEVTAARNKALTNAVGILDQQRPAAADTRVLQGQRDALAALYNGASANSRINPNLLRRMEMQGDQLDRKIASADSRGAAFDALQAKTSEQLLGIKPEFGDSNVKYGVDLAKTMTAEEAATKRAAADNETKLSLGRMGVDERMYSSFTDTQQALLSDASTTLRDSKKALADSNQDLFVAQQWLETHPGANKADLERAIGTKGGLDPAILQFITDSVAGLVLDSTNPAVQSNGRLIGDVEKGQAALDTITAEIKKSLEKVGTRKGYIPKEKKAPEKVAPVKRNTGIEINP